MLKVVLTGVLKSYILIFIVQGQGQRITWRHSWLPWSV